jgi:hypothetical protein
MNSKKIFSLIFLILTISGCSYFSSKNKAAPTNRDAICDDLKNKLMFYQTAPGGMYSGQNQIDPAQQAELMNTYQKYNCDQTTK